MVHSPCGITWGLGPLTKEGKGGTYEGRNLTHLLHMGINSQSFFLRNNWKPRETLFLGFCPFHPPNYLLALLSPDPSW